MSRISTMFMFIFSVIIFVNCNKNGKSLKNVSEEENTSIKEKYKNKIIHIGDTLKISIKSTPSIGTKLRYKFLVSNFNLKFIKSYLSENKVECDGCATYEVFVFVGIKFGNEIIEISKYDIRSKNSKKIDQKLKLDSKKFLITVI